MFSATSQARNRASNSADARKMTFAARTFVKKTPRPLRDWKRQIVAARLARNSEITAGISPLITVWRDAPTTGTKLRQKMRELVQKCALDLGSRQSGSDFA
jgi:hypothetical protein